jgi:hypothetical protein
MSQVLNEGRRTGAYIRSEAEDSSRSRETVIFAAAAAIVAGTVCKVSGGKYVPIGTDGAGAVAIAYDNYNTVTDKRGVASVRDMEANGYELVWPAGIGAPAKATAIAALAAVGIIVRY